MDATEAEETAIKDSATWENTVRVLANATTGPTTEGSTTKADIAVELHEVTEADADADADVGGKGERYGILT